MKDEDDQGAFWASNGEYESRVNFCPVTGRKAPRPLVQKPSWHPGAPGSGGFVDMVWCDQDDSPPSNLEEWEKLNGPKAVAGKKPTVKETKTLAASVLGQDEKKGQGKNNP